ncbi:unnamed protein product [Rotaria sp. Silwood2]|nr:unnamed protein product [Rotaria sp. Silwood2]CAF2528389.1 unnamed protein product [Rotaria sp. Silwood2]CAF2760838.1 unnamed protein product [Rotaria sp. Silwood2]CAF2938820.1 unnamed protein product [Rotaria sp. Silwood2]CAF4147086.1 unnamed protein product [Rotaria sp. Silwood2]
MWIIDAKGEEGLKIIKKEMTYVSDIYKIFDEILVNAADNKQRDSTITSIEIDINQEKGEIKIYNDCRGISIRKLAQDESIYIPTLIFGKLLTDNFNDDQKRVTEDSAKAHAVDDLGVIGHDHYGDYPLKDKMLNVREAITKKTMTENSEVAQLIKILDLNYGEKYANRNGLSKLHYEKLMIMADQDRDGSHIKDLVIIFIING